MVLAIIYVLLASFVAFLGRRRKFGFWGYFFGSLLLTPIIGLLLVLAADSPARLRKRRAEELRLRDMAAREVTAAKVFSLRRRPRIINNV